MLRHHCFGAVLVLGINSISQLTISLRLDEWQQGLETQGVTYSEDQGCP